MGSTTIGGSPDEVKTLVCGWSATKQIFGKPVYNDQDERLDEVEGRKVGLAMLVIDMQSSVG